MDTELPKDLAEFWQGDQSSKFDSMLTLIQLTGGLGDIASSLYATNFLHVLPTTTQN